MLRSTEQVASDLSCYYKKAAIMTKTLAANWLKQTGGRSVAMVILIVGLMSSNLFGQITLVEQSKPCAEIVIDAEPARMTRLAAKELQTYIEKISGAKLPITSTPSDAIPSKIYLGISAQTKKLKLDPAGLAHGAFRMASGKNWIALLGPDSDFTPIEPWARNRSDVTRVLKYWDTITGQTWGTPFSQTYARYSKELDIWEYDDRGTLNAAHELLRSLGVRWYFPGELGEYVPKLATIIIPSVDKVVTPDFALRRFGFFSDQASMSEDERLWQLRMGLNLGPEILGLTLPCHGSKFVYTRPETKAAHPEYYALWRGKRAIDHRECGAPCLSSEGLFDQHLKYSQAIFRHYREPMISLDVCDGYGASLCGCPLCEGKGTPERGWSGQMSDYVWGYVDRMARELYKSNPDKRVSGISYSAYMLPPEKIEQMSPNLSLLMCQTRSTFYTPETREKQVALRNAWLAKLPSKDIYTWDYYLHNRPNCPTEGVPVYFPRLIAEDLRSLKGTSRGDLIEVYRHRDPKDFKWDAMAVMHLNVYITSRLWWDSSANLDAMLEEYYTNMYGPAREQMKRYVEFCEANWMRMTTQAEPLVESMKLLSAARAAAGDGVYGQRVDKLVEYTRSLDQLKARLSLGRENVPEARALLRQAIAPEFDGKVDKEFWKGVRAYDLKDVKTGKHPANPTKFWIAWGSDNALYIGIKCMDPDIKNMVVTSAKNDDTNLWSSDNIELMLETQANSFYQICVGPSGAVLDLDRSGGKLETLWSSNARVKTFIGEDYWSAEICLPAAGDTAKDLDAKNGIAGRRPTETYPWFMNVCRFRVRGANVEKTAWSPTTAGKFDEVLKFGKIYAK
jgi:hypothetical protein